MFNVKNEKHISRRDFLKHAAAGAAAAALSGLLPSEARPRRAQRNPMPDVIVLLPGILGSVLKKDNREAWNVSGRTIWSWLRDHGDSLNELALTNDPPDQDFLGDGVTADRLIDDLHMIPGLWRIDGYTKITKAIQEKLDVTLGKNFFRLPYDWRRDNRVAARRLEKMSSSWLNDWRRSSGNPSAKLILIGHSMGGIVARYFLEVLGGWRDTKALITFGTPYRGSLDALDSLANGVKYTILGRHIDLSRFARSLTSVYQLLPIYPCYDPGDGRMVRVGETSGIPNLESQKAGAALNFHHEIRDKVAENMKLEEYRRNRYQIFSIAGTGRPTLGSARRSGSGVEMSRRDPSERNNRMKDQDGDGTVPSPSAVPPEFDKEGVSWRSVPSATRHASLQNADDVHDLLFYAITTGLYTDFGWFTWAPKVDWTFRLDLEDVYWSDKPVSIKIFPKTDAEFKLELIRTETEETTLKMDKKISSKDWASIKLPELVSPGIYRIKVKNEGKEDADLITVFDRPK